jgi:hypothetical protein
LNGYQRLLFERLLALGDYLNVTDRILTDCQ